MKPQILDSNCSMFYFLVSRVGFSVCLSQLTQTYVCHCINQQNYQVTLLCQQSECLCIQKVPVIIIMWKAWVFFNYPVIFSLWWPRTHHSSWLAFVLFSDFHSCRSVLKIIPNLQVLNKVLSGTCLCFVLCGQSSYLYYS